MVEDDGNFYQVEFNLIASSLGPISQRHRLALQAIDRDFDTTDKSLTPVEEDNEKFLADSLAAAHAAYGVPEAIIVLVCGQEKNVCDQWCPSRRLTQQGIKFKRYSFAELRSLLTVDPNSQRATVLGDEVAIFYLRDGYMPHQYAPEDWTTRGSMENSRAIKCPDATLQLINMKYFQLVLNRQSTWEHFGYSAETFQECRTTFCEIVTVDDFQGDKARMKEFILSRGGVSYRPTLSEIFLLIQQIHTSTDNRRNHTGVITHKIPYTFVKCSNTATHRVSNWVLKPQREGGANNFFDEEIFTQIDTLDVEQLKSFILMEKIFARKRTGVVTNWKEGAKVRPVIDEIGLFHTELWRDSQKSAMLEGGTLVRSKVAGVNEGGVGMGFAVINSIALRD